MSKFIQAVQRLMSKISHLFIFAILSAGTATHAQPTHVVMQLDWIYNAQFAGIYQAVEQGYFAERNLEVRIIPVDPKQQTVPAVLAQSIAFGSAESNVLLRAHASGAPIKVLATMFQSSPLGWMFLGNSGITSFSDLAGKRIGIHPDGEKVIALASKRNGFELDDFILPHVGYDIDVVVSGEVDAMQAYSIDEFVKLQLATDYTSGMIMAKDIGYSAYSQVIFTTEEVVEKHPAVVRDFLKAVQLGWSYALEHKEETVDLILEKYNPSLDRSYQIASMKKIDELVRPNGQQPLAAIEKSVFEKSLNQYLESGMVEQSTNLEDLLELQFNP